MLCQQKYFQSSSIPDFLLDTTSKEMSILLKKIGYKFVETGVVVEFSSLFFAFQKRINTLGYDDMAKSGGYQHDNSRAAVVHQAHTYRELQQEGPPHSAAGERVVPCLEF